MLHEIRSLSIYELVLNIGLGELLIDDDKKVKVEQGKLNSPRKQDVTMSPDLKRVEFPFDKFSNSAFEKILWQVLCVEAMETFIDQQGLTLSSQQYKAVQMYPILREWFFQRFLLGSVIESVDQRVTSDSIKMKQFQF